MSHILQPAHVKLLRSAAIFNVLLPFTQYSA